MFYKIHGVRALIYNNNKLLILKRSSLDNDDAGLWDIPGGKIEPGENIDKTIKREVLEETGIKSSAIIIKDLHGLISGEHHRTNKMTIAVFTCRSTTSDIQLNSEHSEFRWINPKKISSYRLGRVLQAINSSL